MKIRRNGGCKRHRRDGRRGIALTNAALALFSASNILRVLVARMTDRLVCRFLLRAGTATLLLPPLTVRLYRFITA
jgi:hypothetical protein